MLSFGWSHMTAPVGLDVNCGKSTYKSKTNTKSTTFWHAEVLYGLFYNLLGGVTVPLDSRSKGHEFNSRSGRCQVVTTTMGDDGLRTDKLSR